MARKNASFMRNRCEADMQGKGNEDIGRLLISLNQEERKEKRQKVQNVTNVQPKGEREREERARKGERKRKNERREKSEKEGTRRRGERALVGACAHGNTSELSSHHRGA